MRRELAVTRLKSEIPGAEEAVGWTQTERKRQQAETGLSVWLVGWLVDLLYSTVEGVRERGREGGKE